jgi:ATP-binding cassette, subfamily B, bacterial
VSAETVHGPVPRRLRLPFGAVRARLAPFSPRSGRRIAVLVALNTVATFAESLALVLVAQVAVAAAGGRGQVRVGLDVELSGLQALGVALLALAAKLLLSAAAAWWGARLSAETVRCGRLALLDSYFAADWATQSSERAGSLQDYLTTSVSRLNAINQSFISGLNALVSFGVVTLTAVAINPLAAIGCAVAAAILLLLLRPLARRTKQYSKAQSRETRRLATEVTESVRMTQDIRVLGVRDPVLRRLDEAEARASGPLRLANFTWTVAPVVYQTLALAFLVLAVGAVVVVSGDQVASLGAAVILLLRGLAYGQQLSAALQTLATSLPFLDDLHERKHGYDVHAERRGHLGIDGVGVVALHGAGLTYDNGQTALRDVSIEIGRYAAIGVVGPSGSGKSTLVQLLLRLRAPTSGSVTVDGVDLWDITAAAWAERVAFVPQDAALLHGTVSDNIAFFRDVSAEQVEQAAALAYIHDEILSWPEGYQTLVGESGNRLSGGQRQRIVIARALVGSPDLLVLDEPTSALDLPSEARLQDTLRGLRGRVGLVVVAHRLSTIAGCDRVLVLQDGCVQGFDEHERLLETSPFYREAVRLSMITTTAHPS